MIAPVSLRNAVIGGDRVLISYNAGINFYVGNNPDYDSTVNARPGLEWGRIVGQARKAGIDRPSHQSRFFLARSWDYIGSQPLDYISLLARKTLPLLARRRDWPEPRHILLAQLLDDPRRRLCGSGE